MKTQENMQKKNLQLCFERKTRPIGISAANGVKLKIGGIIRILGRNKSDECISNELINR